MRLRHRVEGSEIDQQEGEDTCEGDEGGKVLFEPHNSKGFLKSPNLGNLTFIFHNSHFLGDPPFFGRPRILLCLHHKGIVRFHGYVIITTVMPSKPPAIRPCTRPRKHKLTWVRRFPHANRENKHDANVYFKGNHLETGLLWSAANYLAATQNRVPATRLNTFVLHFFFKSQAFNILHCLTISKEMR